MLKKIPGKLNPPSSAIKFNLLPLDNYCRSVKDVFYRLHAFNQLTKAPWPPIFFGCEGRSRFDPTGGTGTLYLGSTLAGVLMEIFDDRWGPLGDKSRSLTAAELNQWWVTLVATPTVKVLEAHGSNLSKIGTDLQLLSGDHEMARVWALRVLRHPSNVGGILYSSRHDTTQRNLALFHRPGLGSPVHDASLQPPRAAHGQGPAKASGPLVHGSAVRLCDRPELGVALRSLEVAILP